MSEQGYAQFATSMGHKVRQSGGVFWFNAHPHIYMSFPFDREIEPSQVDWVEVLGTDGWAARFTCGIDIGRPSYRIIADQKDYGLASLSGKARNQTRRGLEQCEVRPVSFAELISRGISLNKETMLRQGRKIGAGFEDYWIRYYKNAELAEGAEAWGAFVNGELAAYLIAFRMGAVSHILIVRSSSRFLKQYPNNALIYSYLNYSLSQTGISEVSIGLESIQEGMDTLDHFKIGMGFHKQPTGQRIVLRPVLDRFMKMGGLSITRTLLGSGWGSEALGKLAGMAKWYKEQPGKSKWSH